MKKKYKKITVFILLSLFILISFNPVSSKNTDLVDDQIDQEQTQTSGKDYIFKDHWKVQSFKPTTKTLTRIQLNINKIGNINSDFEIYIRDTLNGKNLTNCSVSSSQIPLTNPEWIEFNFLDINITVDQTYYIICKTKNGDQSNSYNWYESNDNPYDRGTKYESNYSGLYWQQYPDYDFCFKTYGQKAELDIQYIKGGVGWNIYYGIKNIGTNEINNITVDVIFSGGLILTGKTYTYKIDQPISPGELYNNTISPVIGFGLTKITFTVSSPDATTNSKTLQAFLFLFSIYVHP